MGAAAKRLSGAMPVNRLADALGVERTTLTCSAAILKRRRWVRSEASADARLRPIRLTESGRRKLETAFPDWKAAQDRVSAMAS